MRVGVSWARGTQLRCRVLQVGAAGEVAGGVADMDDDEFAIGGGVIDKVGVAQNGSDGHPGQVGRAADAR